MSKLTYRVEINVTEESFGELSVAELLRYIANRVDSGTGDNVKLYNTYSRECLGYAGFNLESNTTA